MNRELMKSDAESNIVQSATEQGHSTAATELPHRFIDSRQKDKITLADERPSLRDYQNLLKLSPSRVACFVFDEDISILQSARNIFDQILATPAYCVEANQNFLDSRGISTTQQILGIPFLDICPIDSGYESAIQAFVENNCQLCRYVLNQSNLQRQESFLEVTMYGLVSDSFMHKFWLIERDNSKEAKFLLELERAEKHFRSLVESDKQVLVRARPDGSYAYISPTVESVVGYTAEHFMQNPIFFRSLLHPDDVHVHDAIYDARKFQSTRPIEVEYRVKSRDGSYKWFLERQTPVFNSTGQVEFYDCLAIDIDYRKQLEEKLRHAERVTTIGKTAAGIAHNFNNHLTAVLGHLKACMSEIGVEHKAYKQLSSAEQAALGCVEIANQLLAFGKERSSPRENFDARLLVDETAELLKHLLPKSINFKASCLESEILIKGSFSELQQVLVNLCLNARDAIDESGFILVSQRKLILSQNNKRLEYPDARAGRYIEFEVQDSGCGIAESELVQIFEPFYTTKKDDGIGLGLSVSLATIQEHGGYIDVESKVGEGTRIRFILPESQLAPGDHELQPKHTPGIRSNTGHETILVAEDEEMVLSMVRSALEINGYTVLCAADGQEALELFDRHRSKIALALIDYTMPRRSGLEVVQEIRKLDQNVPIVFTSGYSHQDTDGWLAQKNEQTQFIGKPYPLPALLSLIRQAIDKSIANS